MCVKIFLSLILVLAYAKADDVVLPYYEVAYTTSGAPCIGGCSPDTHLCVTSWPPKNEPCVLHTTQAPRFRTTQTNSHHRYCLSNCGNFNWNTPWCFVTSAGEWDNCTPLEKQEIANDEVLPYTMVAYTTTGKPCIGGCSPVTHKCVASWPPKNEPCVLYDTPAPSFKTTTKYTTHENCLSNCGAYTWTTPWCYVTSDGKWDHCTPQPQQATAIVSSNGNVVVLPYEQVAHTTSGLPCIGGCSRDTLQCATGFPPKNEPCIPTNIKAPKFSTTLENSSLMYCLSNCGRHAGWSTPWCFVTADGKWDYCKEL